MGKFVELQPEGIKTLVTTTMPDPEEDEKVRGSSESPVTPITQKSSDRLSRNDLSQANRGQAGAQSKRRQGRYSNVFMPENQEQDSPELPAM